MAYYCRNGCGCKETIRTTCMVIRCCYDDLWVAVVSGNCSLNEGLYSVSHETIVYMCSTYVYIYFLSRRSGCGTLQSKTHDHLLGRGDMQ